MAVTAKSFVTDLPEFSNETNYPPSSINYWIAIGVMMLNQGFWGAPSDTATSPPTTMIDFAMEMWVAHNIVLEKQAQDAASVGGDPGTKQGVLNSKSVGGVSAGYDVQAVMELDAGFWNMTIYGTRFIRLARQVGAGPIQIGVGSPPVPFLLFSPDGVPWAGPYPGIMPSDTGF